MQLEPSILDMSWPKVEARLVGFIKDYLGKSKAKGIVLGLSGGIDSSVAATLSARAIGAKNVLGLMLPEKETRNADDTEHVEKLVRMLGIRSQFCDITPILEAFYGGIPIFDRKDRVSKGNIKARARMVYVYYYANKLNMLVCGCSDKSEAMLGYFTKWGDFAADVSPIMDLYKTQVRKLAQHLGIPEEIVSKAPSPNLWSKQTAEGELGLVYNVIDLVLFGLEHFMSVPEIADQLKIPEEKVHAFKERWVSTEHKRRLLLTPKLGYRTLGADFRLGRR